jgi:hypothetical protein
MGSVEASEDKITNEHDTGGRGGKAIRFVGTGS